jgi:ABC-type sulfate transport system substrate-binding protein
MVMKATPIAPFVMPETHLLLEFPVVTLDAPAHFDGGQRQAHRHLAVVSLAQMPTVLSRHTDRVLAILTKARVIDKTQRGTELALLWRLE